MNKTLFLIMIVFLIASLGNLYAQERVTTEYKIGPKDLLEINVVGEPGFPFVVRVTEDGTISLPYVEEEINIEGLTITECERKLYQVLRKFYEDPQVTVFIREYQSKKVLVLGAVRNPGEYDLLGRTTLREIIARAGDFSGSEQDEIRIIRIQEDGKQTSLNISKNDLLIKGIDVPLMPNDTIYVPIDEIVYIYVIGAVRSPRRLEIRESSIPTLVQAIAQAGGFGDRASRGNVVINRINEDGKEVKIEVNVKDIYSGKKKDVQLRPNDTIIVKESVF